MNTQHAGFVDRLPHPKESTRVAWWAALAFSVLLVSLPWLIPLDGRPHADWQQFLGRFHPLVVHLPIGFLVLVPLLEVAGVHRAALREAASFVLVLALASCLLALTLGFLLAHGSGNAGAAVSRHMAGGIALTICVLLCLLLRSTRATGAFVYAYPALLTCTLFTLIWTAHEGGSLTHGSNYLTAYAPAPFARWLAPQAKTTITNSFYVLHIQPILDTKCIACHGEAKSQGSLRMDSYERLMKGGADGPVIIAGNPDKSILLTRVTLPSNHKLFMPAEGKPPLKAEEIALLRAWVQQGASPNAATLNGVSIPDDRAELPLRPVRDYSALSPEINRLAQAQGPKLKLVSSNPSDGLVLFTVDAAAGFDDAQLAKFQKFAPYIVEAELGRTVVSDACFDTLKQFTNLRALHLEQTRVTGNGLAKLAPLSQLTYLNLSGTEVTAASIAPLSAMPNLRHIYLYNTPAQPVAIAEPVQPIALPQPTKGNNP